MISRSAGHEADSEHWRPNEGEADPRPAQGEPYERLAPVEPKSPAVPADAFGALRLPFLGMPTVPPKK